jgi:tetratricopeptide (TPR) repeat protein
VSRKRFASDRNGYFTCVRKHRVSIVMHNQFFVPFWLLALSGPMACGAHATTAPSATPSEETQGQAAEMYERGRLAADRGDSVRAEQYLVMARNRGFDERRVLRALLNVCLSGSRLRGALDHAEGYLRKHPKERGLRYLVATLHLSLQQPDQARIELERLLRLDPQYADAHYLLGVIESDTAPQRALQHFEKYLSLERKGKHAAEASNRIVELTVRVERSPTALAIQGNSAAMRRVPAAVPPRRASLSSAVAP